MTLITIIIIMMMMMIETTMMKIIVINSPSRGLYSTAFMALIFFEFVNKYLGVITLLISKKKKRK